MSTYTTAMERKEKNNLNNQQNMFEKKPENRRTHPTNKQFK